MKRRQERERENIRRLWRFMLIALFTHGVSLPLFDLWPTQAPVRTKSKAIRLVSLSPHAVQRAKQRAQQRKKLHQEQEIKKAKTMRGQVVELPPDAQKALPPEDADYLSEHNTRTERETRSRHQSSEYKNAMSERSRTNRTQRDDPKPAQARAMTLGLKKPGPSNKQKASQHEDQVAFEIPDIKQRDALALRLDPNFGSLRNHRRTERINGKGSRLHLALDNASRTTPKTGSAPTQGPASIDLIPSVGVLAQITGGPMSDHLDDVEEGEGTFLNSREFKFASFFNRLKRGVSQQWKPLNEYRRRDPSGRVYGQQARVTVLQVTLKADGSLKNVAIKRSSGVGFLDREAIAAFQRAEPFPNPPMGLVDNGTGLIDFPFGFHLDFSRRGMRLPF